MDTRTCKYCGIEFHQISPELDEGTFNEGFCQKLHRKYHENQLIKEGKLESVKSFASFGIMKNSRYRDVYGEKIWFPADERPYFDRALQRKFSSVKEKAEYMKENKLVMDGSSDSIHRHRNPDCGDRRYDSRKIK